MTRILGIESSCDECSAAIVEADANSDCPRLVHQIILSQVDLHEAYGGVVPEIACRSHVESMTRVIEQCLQEANLTRQDIGAIAVANHPGLIGALLMGVTTAKALAWAWEIPLIAVDHLEAHLEAVALGGEAVAPPFLGVILSGGHTDLYHVKESGERELIGHTEDDAVGEAFDKAAKAMGLSYPGGPAIEKAALKGDPKAVELPRNMLKKDSLNFSFSGVKTAVLYKWRGQNAKNQGPIEGAPSVEDLAASFQEAVSDVLVKKIRRALQQTGLKRVVLGGGVTANKYIREQLTTRLSTQVEKIVFPAFSFSTDNGAMIAARGLQSFREGNFADFHLDAKPSR